MIVSLAIVIMKSASQCEFHACCPPVNFIQFFGIIFVYK